ncbi:MAG: hypothetical protein IKU11_00625 [Clostridia bacterium]|nr:hypothetical protein [Clostridia bacterium]
MKLTYLGTAAAEGYPALFCRCKYCMEARALGGKNIRTRSQALVNDDLLIDFPADSYHHFLTHGVEFDKVETLIVTHGHSDHFYPRDLYIRGGAFAHDMRSPILQVYGGEGIRGRLYDRAGEEPPNVAFTKVEPFTPFRAGRYEITPLPARHMPGSDPFFYIIKGDKTLLYAHDTGYFYDEVWNYLEATRPYFDMVSLDCTNVDIPIPDEGSHMGFPNIERVLARLTGLGMVDEKTVKIVNHFSHNGNPRHDHLEARAAAYGCLVSYDGMTVEF